MNWRKWYTVFRQMPHRALRTVFPHKARKSNVLRVYEHHARAGESLHVPTPFINYGYVPLSVSEPRLNLRLEDEPFILGPPQKYRERYLFTVQLYLHVAGQVNLADREVLEVGSGQGGGCQFIRRHLGARRVVGLDLSEGNIAAACQANRDAAVTFTVGDAERLPFPHMSFDAVVNIESSHHYPDPNGFFREVHRVLRKGGYFLYADLFHDVGNSFVTSGRRMLQALEQSPLEVLRSTDITANVVASLKNRAELMAATLRLHAADEQQYKTWVDWSRLPGTVGYEKMRSGKDVYRSYLLQRK